MRRLLAVVCLGLAFCSGAGAQEWAKAKLEKSPRHREWVTVRNGGRAVQCLVVYPEAADKAAAVLMIHEIFGLSDWAMDEADQVAAAGYIAILPDLLSGKGPGGGGTSEFPGQDAVIKAVSGLPAGQVLGDLDAAADYVLAQPSCNGHLAVAGFCWGGAKSFLFATHRAKLKAAFVFYGAPPEAKAMKSIQCPVYGFYAGKDARISSTIPDTQNKMNAAGKKYEAVIYEGAGHGFMRAGEDLEGTAANRKARDEGWKRWAGLLKGV